MKQEGLPIEEFGIIWSRIKDLVIKSILGGLTEMREEFKKTSESRYNSYKLLGEMKTLLVNLRYSTCLLSVES